MIDGVHIYVAIGVFGLGILFGQFVLYPFISWLIFGPLPRILKPCDCPTCLVAREHARWRKNWAEHNL